MHNIACVLTVPLRESVSRSLKWSSSLATLFSETVYIATSLVYQEQCGDEVIVLYGSLLASVNPLTITVTICTMSAICLPVRDSYSLKWHEYVCVTTYQPDTKSNPNPNPTKQHAIVNIQLNIVPCPTYPEKFIRDMLLHRLRDFRL